MARALLLIGTAYLGVAQEAGAATLVSGPIAVDTTWSLAQSPYQVTGDVSVENSATLVIEAGVVVGFETSRNLTVASGAMIARGTAGLPITFTSVLDADGGTSVPGDWGQIRFLSGTNDSTTVIEHAEVRYGQGITVQAASPTFNYLKITNNLGSAISIDLNSSPKGVGNSASGNTLNGISVPAGDMTGSVTWGIKGIPYVVSSGVVSIGSSPVITAVTPPEVQLGLSVDAVISGARLTGAESIEFDSAGVSATLTGGGSDTSIPVHITASATESLGGVPFRVRTAAGWARYTSGINVIPLKPTIAVNGMSPESMRRAETRNFQITGSSLLGAQISVPSGLGLTVSNTQTADALASFDLTASATAILGAQTLSVKNPAIANGVVPLLVTIVDALPKINTATIPSAVIPDGVARTFTLSLTNTDTVEHTFNLSSLDPTIISVSPASLTIPAGSTSANFSIAGLKLGYTMLNITSPTLATVSKQIYASSLLNGATVGPILSSAVSITVPYTTATVLPIGTAVPLASKPVGVNTPFTATVSSVLPIGTAVPVASKPVGVNTPFNATVSSVLPVGTSVPVASKPVGVNTPFNATISSVLPIGTTVPVISRPVGVATP